MTTNLEEELSGLIRKLNDEALFVQSEKKHILDLYKQVLKKSEQLFHKQWTIGRQQSLIDDLIFGRYTSTKQSPTTKQICTKYSQLDNNIQFIESHKILGHHDYYISECLKQLRDNPQIVANYLIKTEMKHQFNNQDCNLITNQQIIPIIFQCLYGNCILVQDELYCLQLLKHLIEQQFTQKQQNTSKLNDLFTNNIDLRKLIRKKSCSFNQIFKLYTSFSYSTQLYLTTILREPITQLLSDEWYLDIDSDKALGRFTQEELQQRFGASSSKEYKLKTQKYREKIVQQLHSITCSFIDSISSNLYCFPASLAWLVNQLYYHVSKTSQDNDLARKLCCDLVMALFICPAICDPEPFGIIVDIQISSVARHNLMQIANVLQVLAMSDDDKDLKAQDLYCKFRNNCVSDILNSIIAPNIRNQSNQLLNDTSSSLFAFDPIQSTFLTMFNNNNNNLNNEMLSSSISNASSSIAFNPHTSSLVTRSSVIIQLQDIHKLLIYLRQISKELPVDSDDHKWIKSIIPTEYLKHTLETAALNLNTAKQATTISRRQSEQNLLSLLNADSNEVISSILKEPDSVLDYQILIININDKSLDCPGMLNEDKVINDLNTTKLVNKTNTIKHNNNNTSLDSSYEPNIKKVSSFGLMIMDRDDINSVGISEAGETNGSIQSSNDSDDNNIIKNDDEIDDDNRGDGLSDFDNFSGRDTPIISGRDTSSSHSHEDLHNISSSNNNPIRTNVTNVSSQQMRLNNISNQVVNRGPQLLPITVQKANREDINDKFCKFEISKTNQPVKEEQLSEAWSLDADPPESVMNDPLDDNTASLRLNSSSSVNTNSDGRKFIDLNAASLNCANNLISFDSEQETKSTLKTNESLPVCLTNITDSTNHLANDHLINPTTSLPADLNDLNQLDDRYSVISDNAAWSTDLITNSDSDLESNSPSKYASSYSRTSSYQNSDFGSSYMNQAAALNPQTASQQQSTNPISYNASFADLIKNSVKSIDSGLIDSWHYSADTDNITVKPATTTAVAALTASNTPTSSVAQSSKSRLKKIFSSNSQTSGVKFSLKSNQANKPRGGLHRIFSISNKNKNDSQLGAVNPVLNPATESENQSDNIDNILKKYSNNNKPVNTNESVLIDLSIPSASCDSLRKNFSSNSLQQNQQNDIISYDSTNLEHSKFFLNAKKKTRNVLSWSDCFNFLPLSTQKNPKENFLRMYLKTQLYEAISNQDKEKEAQLHETIRCVSIFNDKDCRKLIRSLKSDYIKRTPYIIYLTKSKQNILHSIHLIDKLQQRTKWYQTICTHHLTSVVTRTFLEHQDNEKQLNQFVNNFRQLQIVDEKFDLFKNFINLLKNEFNLIWNDCDVDTIEFSVVCLERLIIPKVYRFAMYPNGDIDHYRDSKVFECFNELSNIITPLHPLICIPQIYENECPWTAAQIELRRINIYKTPQDKLSCIRQCLLTIQNLLAMAKSPVCADDLHPVLIYVIIKANPPTFLSNVQYIEGYYGKQLESEDYYWAQFIFAFSYIKANMLSSIN